MRDSTIAAFGQEAYELDIIERKILGRPRFIVNDPAAVKHVLLDNAANYEKTEIMRRILEPGLGKGLLTSEGETWKVHRRTMTPAFDQRSVAAYTAVMTGAAEELMGRWDSVGPDTTVDVSIAMTEVTLQIISRTMFSSDSDDMAAIMERSFGEYQAQMRPNLLDFDRHACMACGSRQDECGKAHVAGIRYHNRPADCDSNPQPGEFAQGFARSPDRGAR